MNRRDEVEARIQLLILDFEKYVLAFEEKPAFSKPGQLDNHVKTIRLREELGTVSAALQDREFLDSLYSTLVSWGIGSRGSNFVDRRRFAKTIQEHTSTIIQLEEKRLDDSNLNIKLVTGQAWAIIESLDIVQNKAKLVPCTKALHHILPELIVPMDRLYTRTFFGWHVPEFQYKQENIFYHALSNFARIAKETDPRQYKDSGWRTSLTKIVDNALVAFCREEKLRLPS